MKNSKNNQSGIAHLALILVIVLVAAIGGVGYYVWNNNKTTASKDVTSSDKANTSENDKNDSSLPTVESIAEKVILTLGATGEQKAVQARIKDFHEKYEDIQKTDDINKRNKQADLFASEYMTDKLQTKLEWKGHVAGTIDCHQYRPMIIVGFPDISENLATVPIQPVDLVDGYAEKPHTLSIVKQNSKWFVDSINCSST